MSTPYNPLVPTGLVNLDEDYANLQQNFAFADTSFGVDHIKFSVSANNGYHQYVHLVDSSASLPVTAIGQMALYNRLDTESKPQLFIKRQNGATEYQMTTILGTNAFNSAFGANPGVTFLPGGLIVQYGNADIALTTGVITTTFPIAFPNACFLVIPQAFYDGASVPSGDIVIGVENDASFPSKTQFKIKVITSSSSYTGFSWVAIGN